MEQMKMMMMMMMMMINYDEEKCDEDDDDMMQRMMMMLSVMSRLRQAVISLSGRSQPHCEGGFAQCDAMVYWEPSSHSHDDG